MRHQGHDRFEHRAHRLIQPKHQPRNVGRNALQARFAFLQGRQGALHALFGLPEEQTVRNLETFLATVHPDDRAGVIERCRRCASEGADFDMEFRVVWPDGSLHWLDDKGRTTLDEAGRPSYMTGTCVDITTQKLNEESMQKQQGLALTLNAIEQPALRRRKVAATALPFGQIHARDGTPASSSNSPMRLSLSCQSWAIQV